MSRPKFELINLRRDTGLGGGGACGRGGSEGGGGIHDNLTKIEFNNADFTLYYYFYYYYSPVQDTCFPRTSIKKQSFTMFQLHKNKLSYTKNR